MPLSIGCVALLGWWAAGLVPASALLLGAALAPTDPVLASDVQVGPPGGEEEDDVRFSLTSEAGLNDGLAFPFTNAAVAMAAAGSAGASSWLGGWVLDDVVVKLSVGLIVGVLAGRAIGYVLFRLPPMRPVAESTEGFVALAATLLVYGVAELAHGYGFVSVFVAAYVIRDHERDHDYHEVLHASAESIERLVSAALLVLLGGAIVDGALGPLTLAGAAVGIAIVLVVRPVVGWLSLIRTATPTWERWAIAFFGIRGVGSVYYLAYALTEADFPGAEELWAITAFVILLSVVVHGLSAAPILRRVDARRELM
jgi:NhaP-type Na+/H+ or K+/H+ antiporter